MGPSSCPATPDTMSCAPLFLVPAGKAADRFRADTQRADRLEFARTLHRDSHPGQHADLARVEELGRADGSRLHQRTLSKTLRGGRPGFRCSLRSTDWIGFDPLSVARALRWYGNFVFNFLVRSTMSWRWAMGIGRSFTMANTTNDPLLGSRKRCHAVDGKCFPFAECQATFTCWCKLSNPIWREGCSIGYRKRTCPFVVAWLACFIHRWKCPAFAALKSGADSGSSCSDSGQTIS